MLCWPTTGLMSSELSTQLSPTSPRRPSEAQQEKAWALEPQSTAETVVVVVVSVPVGAAEALRARVRRVRREVVNCMVVVWGLGLVGCWVVEVEMELRWNGMEMKMVIVDADADDDKTVGGRKALSL